MGAGVDPHLYRPTYQDIELLQKADIIITNGLKLEGKLAEVLGKMKNKTILEVGAAIPIDSLKPLPGREFDPHIWLDPALWRTGLAAVFDSLSVKFPENADKMEKSGKAYLEKIKSTETEMQLLWEKITAESRVLVTAHDAFGYYGHRFGVQVRSLQGTSTVAEFGLRDINDLVDFIVSRNIRAIFTENIVSPKAIEAVIDGCRKRGKDVRLGATLYTDALGEPGTAGDSYPGLLLENTRIITEAIGND